MGRLAARVNEEAEERATAAQARHAEQVSQHQQATAALKIEAQSTRQQLEHTQRTLAEEKTARGTTSEALNHKTLECTQLAQQVLDLQERLAAEERHRQSLEALMARSNSPTLGHPKFPQAGQADYDDSSVMAMRAAASLRR
ncbi:MAG: hypothetical protein Q8S71_23025 [Hydrogenophaga sp.]|nr:hypothetical protein [Hydrogenophaga sp.]